MNRAIWDRKDAETIAEGQVLLFSFLSGQCLGRKAGLCSSTYVSSLGVQTAGIAGWVVFRQPSDIGLLPEAWFGFSSVSEQITLSCEKLRLLSPRGLDACLINDSLCS